MLEFPGVPPVPTAYIAAPDIHSRTCSDLVLDAADSTRSTKTRYDVSVGNHCPSEHLDVRLYQFCGIFNTKQTNYNTKRNFTGNDAYVNVTG